MPLIARARIVALAMVGSLWAAPLPAAAPADADAPLRDRVLPEALVLRGQVFHVQGLDLDDDFIYVTSIDKKAHRAFLHKFTRAGGAVATVELTDGSRDHPGGISLQGTSLWVPLAEPRAHSSTRILQIDATTLTTVSSFMVDDHIGAVAADEARIYGSNWSARRFYVWTHAGALLANAANTTRIAYQELKIVDGELVASGTIPRKKTGTVDWLDPVTLAPRQRLAMGRMRGGPAWTREGMALKGDRLYLLPADGHRGRADVYVFDLADLQPAAFECIADADAPNRCPRGRRGVAAR
jgi:hypothetical protein